MDVLSGFDLDKNFWHLNPQFKVAFKDLYKGDKSKQKSASSKFMWSVALYIHPRSVYTNTTFEFKEDMIQKEFYPAFDPKDEEQAKYIELFQDITGSHTTKILDGWKKDLEDRNTFLFDIKWSTDTDPALLKLKADFLAQTKRLWDAYIAATKDVEEEQSKAQGDRRESLSEQGIL